MFIEVLARLLKKNYRLSECDLNKPGAERITLRRYQLRKSVPAGRIRRKNKTCVIDCLFLKMRFNDQGAMVVKSHFIKKIVVTTVPVFKK